MAKDAKDNIIHSLSEALKEALIWLCVENASPPYSVPYAIQCDMWKRTFVKDSGEAIKIIQNAVNAVAAGANKR